jgi:hypothetical protein
MKDIDLEQKPPKTSSYRQIFAVSLFDVVLRVESIIGSHIIA